MIDETSLRLQLQYKLLNNNSQIDKPTSARANNVDVAKKLILSSCYWSFESAVTSLSLLRTCDDRRALAAGTFSNTVKVFTLSENIPFLNDEDIYDLKPASGFYKVLDVDIHPRFFTAGENNGKVVTAASDGQLRFWTCDKDKKDQQLCQLYNIGSAKVNKVKVLDDFNIFASISSDGCLKITDIETALPIMSITKNDVELSSMALHPSNNLIYTGDCLGYGTVWDLRCGKYICDFNNFVDFETTNDVKNDLDPFDFSFRTARITNLHKSRVTRSEFDNSGVLLTTGSDDHYAHVWDLRKQKLIKQVPAHTNRIVFSQFAADNNILITASCDGQVRFWDWYTLTIINELETGTEKTTCAAYDKCSNTLFTGDLHKKLSIYS